MVWSEPHLGEQHEASIRLEERVQRLLMVRSLDSLTRFASIGLLLQLYTSQVYRKRARKCLGQAHRRVLLLTDDLADAQQDVDDETWPERIPTLHREEARARESSSSLSAISASLKSAETQFQHIRLGLKRASCEMVTNGCELVFALYELVLPTMEKEALEGWSEVGAGLTGIWRVFLD